MTCEVELDLIIARDDAPTTDPNLAADIAEALAMVLTVGQPTRVALSGFSHLHTDAPDLVAMSYELSVYLSGLPGTPTDVTSRVLVAAATPGPYAVRTLKVWAAPEDPGF